jgi:hypothetical protein
MVRDFDHGPSGVRMDVDSGSWALGGGSWDPFEPGALLWPLARVGVASVPGSGSAGWVLPASEQKFALDLKQAGFDRTGTTKPPQQAC